jgi:adenylyl-sulfate kinase
MTSTSSNVTWHSGTVAREQRWDTLGQRGATVWFTGLPASGKSTVSAAVEARLIEERRPAYRLDGDNLRHGVCGDLGFSAEDRDRNVRRTAEVARLFADAGLIAIVSIVSPYSAARAAARELHERDGLRFVEVFVNTPLEVCEQRDPKGLYARARAGELRGFTGVDDPYEPPREPDVELCVVDVETAVAMVLQALDG